MKKIIILYLSLFSLLISSSKDFFKYTKNIDNSFTLDFELNDGYGIQLSVNSIKLLNDIGFQNIEAYDISLPKKVNFYDAKDCKQICDIDVSKFNYKNIRVVADGGFITNYRIGKKESEDIFVNLLPRLGVEYTYQDLYYFRGGLGNGRIAFGWGLEYDLIKDHDSRIDYTFSMDWAS